MARTKEELTRLIRGAMGEIRADLIITRGKLVNVYSGEILGGMEIAVIDRRICYVGANASVRPPSCLLRILEVGPEVRTPGS